MTAIKARGHQEGLLAQHHWRRPTRIEAQPLYAPDVKMADGTTRDVIYVFSMSNNVWGVRRHRRRAALAPTRFISLGKPFPAGLLEFDAVDPHHINRSFGVLSTPVIDRETNTIYAVSRIVDAQNNRQLLSSTRFTWPTANTPPLLRRAQRRAAMRHGIYAATP